MIRTTTAVLLVLASSTVQAAEPVPTEQQVLTWLSDLDPLPKVHYSWPLPFDSISDELLTEYVRITHAVSIAGEWHNPEQIDRTVRICGLVNQSEPKVPASIGVNYSVWHRRFGKDLPPTDTGSTHQAELDYLTEQLESVRDQVAATNERHGTNVQVSAILYDSERFYANDDNPEWNRALTAKYNAAWDIARDVFPHIRIEWYGRGGAHPSASPTGWTTASYFSLDEKGDSFGCSLYHGPEIGYTREIFRRTAALAAEHDCEEVTPWISLASGYRRQTEKYHEFSLDWNYDLIYSWQLGAEVNHAWFGAPERHERFAPWNKAQVAIFYPEPFGRSPYWGQHFVAYVRGAHLIRELPEIENE